MRRRQFLLSGAATALVAAASALVPLHSLQAHAATRAFDVWDLPIEELGRINEALNTAQDYSVTLEQMANLFGLNPHGFKDFAALRDFVFDLHGFDVRERAGYLVAIREKLDERFGRNNIAAHWEWMDSTPLTTWPPEPDHPYTIYDTLHSHNMFDLYYVAKLLDPTIA